VSKPIEKLNLNLAKVSVQPVTDLDEYFSRMYKE